MDEAETDKQELRDEARAARARAYGADVDNKAAEQVAARFLAEFQVEPGEIVAGYWPNGDELDVRPLLIKMAAMDVRLCLPVAVGADQPLEFRRWEPGDALETGAFGIYQPPPSSPVLSPRLLLVPLLAFDAQGWRLGYGGGYYDRTLAALRAADGGRSPVRAIGVAYAAQEVAALPHHGGDQRLDGVVTELAVRRFDHGDPAKQAG